MPIYQVELTLPINGTITSQTELSLKVNSGEISDLYVLFPGGHAGLTRVRILQRGSQIMPFNNLAYLLGDSVLYRFRPFTDILGGGIPLVFSGYNLDDTYPHTVYFTFDIQEVTRKAIKSLRERLGL